MNIDHTLEPINITSNSQAYFDENSLRLECLNKIIQNNCSWGVTSDVLVQYGMSHNNLRSKLFFERGN